MRERRIKIPSEEAESVHHVMSREVDRAPPFDDEAKEVLRRLLRDTAEGCGLQLLTHAEMDTHFHGLVRVPKKPTEPVSDAELLRRYRLLHPAKTRRNEARAPSGPSASRACWSSRASMWCARWRPTSTSTPSGPEL